MDRKLCQVLKKSRLFSGLSEEDFPHVLECLRAQDVFYPKGKTILHIGEEIRKAGIVTDGKAEILFYDETVNPVTVRHLYPGDLFGQIVISDGDHRSPIELSALTDCSVLLLDLTPIVQKGNCEYHSRISVNLLRDFAEHSAFLNMKLRVIGQKRLRDRILVYLHTLREEPDGTVRIPYNMTELAAFLCVDRSALYREIRKMREEGLLTWEGKTVQLL